MRFAALFMLLSFCAAAADAATIRFTTTAEVLLVGSQDVLGLSGSVITLTLEYDSGADLGTINAGPGSVSRSGNDLELDMSVRFSERPGGLGDLFLNRHSSDGYFSGINAFGLPLSDRLHLGVCCGDAFGFPHQDDFLFVTVLTILSDDLFPGTDPPDFPVGIDVEPRPFAFGIEQVATYAAVHGRTTVTVVPEPSSALLLSIGLIGLARQERK